MPLNNLKDKLLYGLVLGLFIWFFASSLFIAYHKAPQNDDAMFATIPKNFLNGYGWATSYGEKIPFNPDISTGPTLLLPAAAIIAVFGNQTWVPAITGTIMNMILVILILWQLWQLARYRIASSLALLLAISLFAVNDFKTFTGYYTCSLLFLFSLLFVLNKNHSSTIRFIVFGILAAIGFYGKPLILLSFLIAFPGILLVEKDLTFVKTGKLFSIALFSFIFIIAPWQIYKNVVLSGYSESYQDAYKEYDKKFFDNHGTGIGQLKNTENKISYFKFNSKKNWRILSKFLGNENNLPVYLLFSILGVAFFIPLRCRINIKKTFSEPSKNTEHTSFEVTFPAILALVIFGNFLWYIIFSFAMTPGHAFFLTFFCFFLLFFLITAHSRSDMIGILLCVFIVFIFQVRLPPLAEAYRFKVSDIIDNEQINKTLRYLQTHDHRYPLASCGYSAAPYRMEYLLPASQNFVDCYNVLEDSLVRDSSGTHYVWQGSPNFTFVFEFLSFLGAARSQGYILTPIAETCKKHVLFSEGIFAICEVSFDEIKDRLDPTETAKQLVDYQRWYRTRIKVYGSPP